ncbi:hypothetical protein [Halobellus marinus]|uniref:hypothetical protein n=1 Tax=Halobellus TaxID=1073986 RepID=UPI0028A83598|nr:hypothetical protein [Halobellus sp. DFY28]
MSPQLTDEQYDLSDDFAAQLKSLVEDARITEEKAATKRILGEKLKQKSYTISVEGTQVSGFETIFPGGVMMSLEGDLGLASAYILANAAVYGKISQAYLDQGTQSSIVPASYHDLTAEWYRPAINKTDFAKRRLESRGVEYDTERVEVSEIEDWAQKWLSLNRD